MSQQSYRDCSTQGNQCEREELELTLLASGKGLFNLSFLKLLQLRSEAKSSSAAIGKGGVRGSDASTLVDIKSSHLSVVDAATLSTRGGSGPCVNFELRGFNGKRPTSVNHKNVTPSDGVFVKGIDDDHSFITENYFGADQVDVNRDEREERNQRASYLGSGAGIVKIRPREKSADNYAEYRKVEVGSRTENLSVIHSTILSHIMADTIKAVS